MDWHSGSTGASVGSGSGSSGPWSLPVTSIPGRRTWSESKVREGNQILPHKLSKQQGKALVNSLTNNVDETLASLDIEGNDARHLGWVTWIGSSLLEDTINSVMSQADSPGVLPVQHFNSALALQVSRGNLSSDNMEQKDVSQEHRVVKGSIKDGTKGKESVIGRSENSEPISSKSIDKVSSYDSGT